MYFMRFSVYETEDEVAIFAVVGEVAIGGQKREALVLQGSCD
jgi:hypothetical protein